MKFVKSQARFKPQLVEVVGNMAYVRKNITSEEVQVNDELTLTFYNYDEATMTIPEFNAYANELLMGGQEDNANNMLVLMEAFADLYETMALTLEQGG